MKIVVIAGKARSGKDTISQIIKKYYQDKKVIIYPITYYLKDYTKKITDWDGNDEDKPRELLQTLGKNVKEKYPDIFIRRMEEDIKLLQKYCDILIITGVRLVKELEFFKNLDSIIIKVESDRENNLTLKEKQDITETDVDRFKDYDYIIYNNGQNLDKKVLKILKEVKLYEY